MDINFCFKDSFHCVTPSFSKRVVFDYTVEDYFVIDETFKKKRVSVYKKGVCEPTATSNPDGSFMKCRECCDGNNIGYTCAITYTDIEDAEGIHCGKTVLCIIHKNNNIFLLSVFETVHFNRIQCFRLNQLLKPSRTSCITITASNGYVVVISEGHMDSSRIFLLNVQTLQYMEIQRRTYAPSYAIRKCHEWEGRFIDIIHSKILELPTIRVARQAALTLKKLEIHIESDDSKSEPITYHHLPKDCMELIMQHLGYYSKTEYIKEKERYKNFNDTLPKILCLNDEKQQQ